jgi:hypothetical protein
LPMALPSSLSFNPALHPWIFTLGQGLFNVPHMLSQFFVWTGQGSTIAVNTALWAQTSCRHCMLPFSLVSATTTQQYIFISPQKYLQSSNARHVIWLIWHTIRYHRSYIRYVLQYGTTDFKWIALVYQNPRFFTRLV